MGKKKKKRKLSLKVRNVVVRDMILSNRKTKMSDRRSRRDKEQKELKQEIEEGKRNEISCSDF